MYTKNNAKKHIKEKKNIQKVQKNIQKTPHTVQI